MIRAEKLAEYYAGKLEDYFGHPCEREVRIRYYSYLGGYAAAVAELRSEEAKHSIMRDGKVWTGGKEHEGPTLMSAKLWADWLCREERDITPEESL